MTILTTLLIRTGHTYLDFLAYLHKHPGVYVWQLDFLGSIKTDTNNILSFILPNLQFVLLDLIKNPNQEKVVTFFDDLEERIGTDAFIELIPVILTDRDPNFTDIDGIASQVFRRLFKNAHAGQLKAGFFFHRIALEESAAALDS